MLSLSTILVSSRSLGIAASGAQLNTVSSATLSFGTGGVFSSDRGGANLDGHIAGLFALMKPGTVMITLHDLRSNIGFSQKLVAEKRKARNLPNATSVNASFFEYAEVSPLFHYLSLDCACDIISCLISLRFCRLNWASSEIWYPGQKVCVIVWLASVLGEYAVLLLIVS